jgi:hypothetical protein
MTICRPFLSILSMLLGGWRVMFNRSSLHSVPCHCFCFMGERIFCFLGLLSCYRKRVIECAFQAFGSPFQACRYTFRGWWSLLLRRNIYHIYGGYVWHVFCLGLGVRSFTQLYQLSLYRTWSMDAFSFQNAGVIPFRWSSNMSYLVIGSLAGVGVTHPPSLQLCKLDPSLWWTMISSSQN